MRLMICTFLTFFAFGPLANAAVLIEPYVGYSPMGNTEVVTSTTSKYDLTGMSFGARLGVKMLGLMAGAEYTSSNLKDEDSNAVTGTDLGVFVGYSFPILLRVWGGYIFQASAKSEADSDNTWKGSGYKLGVGYNLIPLVSLNLEYISRKLDDPDEATIIDEVKTTSYMLSVSMPLSF